MTITSKEGEKQYKGIRLLVWCVRHKKVRKQRQILWVNSHIIVHTLG